MRLLAFIGVFVAVCGDGERSGMAAADAARQVAPGSALDTAIFAGGCFWCMEPPFDALDGVVATISGYTAGRELNPTYEQVSSGNTGHTEAVMIVYDPARVSYERLLSVFWVNIDPLARNRQFCDRGAQYRSGVYFRGDTQGAAAAASRDKVAQRFGDPIATEIERAGAFFPAEEYHQDYYRKNPIRYKFYRSRCGRDARLKDLWGELAGKSLE